MLKNKKIIIILCIMILILVIFSYKFLAKNFQTGNNKTSQEIVDYILNMNSYISESVITINSNKNTNKYVLKQEYTNLNISMQEVLEPENIKGMKIINDGTNLSIENTKLDLNTIYENYEYLNNNSLDLMTFIKDYKESGYSNYEEKNDTIIMKVEVKNSDNKYTRNKTLHIDSNTGLPVKLEIKDINNNVTVYILYNNIVLNNIT